MVYSTNVPVIYLTPAAMVSLPLQGYVTASIYQSVRNFLKEVKSYEWFLMEFSGKEWVKEQIIAFW